MTSPFAHKDFVLSPDTYPINLSYGVQLWHNAMDGEKTKVHYVILAKKYTSNKNLAERFLMLDRAQVYINDSMPDLQADKLADALGKTLYPIEIALPYNDQPLAVANEEQIIQRYKDIKPQLSAYYYSVFGAEVLAAFEKNIGNMAKLIEAIRNDWFVHLVFGAIIFGVYEKGQMLNHHFTLPIIPYMPPIQFVGDLLLEQSEDEEANGILCIMVAAICNDPRNWADAWKGSPVPISNGNNNNYHPLQGKASFSFKLRQQNKSILVAEGSAAIEVDGNKYSVEIGIYDLNPIFDKKQIPPVNGRDIIILSEVVAPNKKSFFQKLFNP